MTSVVTRGLTFAVGFGLTVACSSTPPKGISGDGGSAGSAGSAANTGATDQGGTHSGGSAANAGTGATSETCAVGDSKSCYESPEGMSYGGMPPEGQQTCRVGVAKCSPNGEWEPCVGAVGPLDADTCDPGNDATCNGTPNEGCACTSGETRPCGSDVGNCVTGTQTCADQKWGECVGEVKPAAADTCDEGDDANCDDKPNDGCACINGATKDCGTDIGPCEFGTLTCTNGAWPDDSKCMGGVKAAAEDTCEPGNDANCNNTPNEKCKCTGSEVKDCGLDVGACKFGQQTCDGGTLSMCMGGVNPATNDTCTGRAEANDTNCNGITGDGCECVASDGPGTCGDSGCGSKACDGATGKYKACTGDNVTVRCNPNDTTKRQVCGVNGVYVAKDCAATEQCTGAGICKSKDGEACSNGTTCLSGTCNAYYTDGDSDGYRKNSTVVNLCGAGKAGFVATASNLGDDCDDTTDKVHPGLKEACDGLDNDCDNLVDFADTDPLALSGNAKATATGIFSGIASAGANYGFMYFKPSTTQMVFSTLTQANAVTTPKDIVIGTDYNRGVIVSDGSSYGVFQRSNFRRVTPGNGALSTPVTLQSFAGATQRWAAARMGTGGWLMVGTMDYGVGNNFGVNDFVSAADVEGHSTLADIDGQVRWSDVAVSGTTYGVVWESGTGPNSIVYSPRTSTGAASATVPALASATGLTKPVIAARKGGGFVILWADAGSKIYLKEVNTNGSEVCATVSKTFANFKPEQMVATSRGYLAVSGAGKMVQGQEILPGCKWGGALPTIGTADTDAKPRIAAGANGFAVIWEQDVDYEKNVYTRTFGPNFCD